MKNFCARVYRAVLAIPLGQTRTYAWVAAKAGKPKAARAVGQLMKRNPFPLLIPCHRVVASGGKAGGYSGPGGVAAKRRLIELERQIAQSML
jgi:methylated-DNA-[protein]-cysteine S-methyltransferase